MTDDDTPNIALYENVLMNSSLKVPYTLVKQSA